MHRLVIRFALTLAAVGLCQAAAARDGFCSVDHVSVAGRGVELHFIPWSGLFVRIGEAGHAVASTDRMYTQIDGEMHRTPANQNPDAKKARVLLTSGEEAFVGGDPHSSCTIRLAHQSSRLGVTMAASVGLPGLPPKTTTRFLPVAD